MSAAIAIWENRDKEALSQFKEIFGAESKHIVSVNKSGVTVRTTNVDLTTYLIPEDDYQVLSSLLLITDFTFDKEYKSITPWGGHFELEGIKNSCLYKELQPGDNFEIGSISLTQEKSVEDDLMRFSVKYDIWVEFEEQKGKGTFGSTLFKKNLLPAILQAFFKITPPKLAEDLTKRYEKAGMWG